jgi:O-antigen/teichoic acid export membrane protein
LSHSLLYFIVRVGNGLLVIATMAIFSRLLSPAEYGLYALGLATAAISSSVFFQWINAAVGRFYPLHQDEPSKVLNAAAKGYLIATVLGTSVLLAGIVFQDLIEVKLSTLIIIFFTTIFLAMHSLALQVANVRNEPHLYGLLSWSKLSGTLLFGSTLIYFGGAAPAALMGIIFGIFFSIIAFGGTLIRRIGLGASDQHLTLDMLRYGLPLTVNYIAIVVVDVSDRFMIGNLLGMNSVGPYALAYDFVQQTIGPVMNILYLVAFPSLVRIYANDGDVAICKQMHMLGTKLIAVGLPFTLGVCFFSENIANFIFGIEYRKTAIDVMPLLACAIFLSAFKSYYLDIAIQLHNMTKYLAYSAMIMAGVNVSLNLLLLPLIGVKGAALATFIAFLIGAILSWIQSSRLLQMPNLKNILWKFFIANLGMLLAWQTIPGSESIWILIKLFLGVLVYLGIGAALNIVGFRLYLNQLFTYLRVRLP